MYLPEFLEEMLNNQYSEDIISKIIDGYNSKRKLTFRTNTIKATVEEIEKVLKENRIEYSKPIWSKEAFIVENASKKQIEDMPIYQDGKIYLQSLSSMLPPIVLEPKENMDILDMAAAPGGKTTQLAALTNNNAHITACEMNMVRMERLKYNLEKQGATSVFTMQIDSRNLNDFFSFDKVLLDAPCSRKRNYKHRR